MQENQHRVLAIHDISGFGRCSLTVILPILSAMGIQCCPVPTAVLSTHTGGLGDVVARDLTNYMGPCLAHYRELGLEYDCIYTGFLNSKDQIDHCLDFFDAYPDAFKLVDPVMGDHGKAYRTCTSDLRMRMEELVCRADLITPNLTECAMLLGTEYETGPIDSTTAKSLLVRLSKMGPGYVVITGVALSGGTMANIGYDRERNAFWKVECDYVPVSYPGTGDIYASALVGSLLNGDSLPIAMERSTRFLEVAIKTTFSYGTDTRYGVMLERALPYLMTRETLKDYEIL